METAQCYECKNYTNELTCKAFPTRIPSAILEGRFDHSDEWPGDRGIRFQAKTPAERTPDFSDHTNQTIINFLRALPDLFGQKKYFIKVMGNPDALADLDSYPDYNGRRLLISKEVIGKVAEAAATIKSPVLVMRDFLKRPNSNERTYSEVFVGLTKFKDGRPALIAVETNRGLIVRVMVRDRQNDEDIIDALSGVVVFKKGF